MSNFDPNILPADFPSSESIESLIVAHVPKDLIAAMEEALITGAAEGAIGSGTLARGHRAHAIGHMRHFRTNERFFDALTAADASPTPLNGNRLVVGRIGIFSISRFNVTTHFWGNAKRSKARRQLAMFNRAIEHLVSPDLFESYKPAQTASLFAVGVFDRSPGNALAELVRVDIAIPRPDMDGWLYRQPVAMTLALYESKPQASQPDMAHPVLKTNIVAPKKQNEQ
ncbi:hypothetical protein [Hydrogenophaga sp. H7]|uniref:hypothetical protein n=1 Tax=Hydrogenophaga sp. H7 TaxID=1882399 RepID=UPI0009A3A381|nr:hypothetical protein [Hydrogenophaga sp. H7]OPF64086.1 hypothetical protein BC358_04275 [Hydrogenophaga sp. H7]